jgi:hypothetical protein
MITSIYIWDAANLSGVELDTLTYPLQKFSWEYPIVGDDVMRPFASGQYDTRKSVGSMTIDCEGTIVTNSTTDYWTARKALVAKVLPLADQISYNHSTLKLKVDGDTQEYIAEIVLSSYSIPLASTGAPTISEFQFSWTCNKGYWLANGSPVLL